MGRSSSFLSLPLAVAFLTLSMIQPGCASFTNAREDHLQRVHPGQTEAEVTETLGAPSDKIERNGEVIWHYEIYTTDSRGRYPYSAYFDNGKLLKIQMEQASYKDVTDKKDKQNKVKGFYSVSVRHESYYDPSAPGPQEDWRPGSAIFLEQHP